MVLASRLIFKGKMADETAAAASAAVLRVAGQMEEVSGYHLRSPLECILLVS